MAYFQRDDIPFHWALADAFTICDGYHCSMMGPTWPNRLYLMTGRSTRQAWRRPGLRNYVPAEGYSWTTYPELLTKAGVCWKVYQENDNYGMNVLEYFDQYQAAPTPSPLYQNAMRFYQAGQFEYDAVHDRLPTVSWIIPTSYQSEHPDFMPAAGADFVASKVNAIAANPDVWAKTVFVLIYDENDGYFDHVTPAHRAGGHARRVHHGQRGQRPDRPRLPGALHYRVAVDGRRLRLPRHVRPHLGHPADREGHRRRQPQHQRLAAEDRRRPHRGPGRRPERALPAAPGHDPGTGAGRGAGPGVPAAGHPGKDQSFPVQPPGRKPVRDTSRRGSGEGSVSDMLDATYPAPPPQRSRSAASPWRPSPPAASWWSRPRPAAEQPWPPATPARGTAVQPGPT